MSLLTSNEVNNDPISCSTPITKMEDLNNKITPSDEQQEIISSFTQGYNIKVEAVAGSGKSTTLLLLAQEAKDKFRCKTLILTYNRDLKDELQEKITRLNLSSHCDAYTYHGYASRMYHTSIYDDKLLHHHLTMTPRITSAYPIILLDEVQDMNPDYHKLSQLIIKHGDILVIVGDRRQCINDYLNASNEYLIDYSTYFNTGRPWRELSLRTSYRLTPYLANFVNKHVLKEDIILPGNFACNNVKPIYHYGVWDISPLIKYMFDLYGPDEVIILVPSIKVASKPNSPIGKLLSRQHDDMLFCVRDTDTSSETTRNKIVVTSYNSMKGRERKCVIVTGFDESYFEYFDKKWSHSSPLIPNIIYVAATRARERLIIIQDKNKLPFRTIDKDRLSLDVEIRGNSENAKPKERTKDSVRNVVDIIKHRNLTDILELLSFINIEPIIPAGKLLPYQNIVQFNGYFEDMRQYYGLLITLYAQYKRDGETYLTVMDIDNVKSMTDVYCRYNALIMTDNKTIKEWMELVVMYCAITNKHHFYKDQITNYDWVDEGFVTEAADRIIATIPTNGVFEYPCSGNNIAGVVDYISETEMWEFKCTTSLTDDHKIQCGAYIALQYIDTEVLVPCKLYNVRTGEIVIITITNPAKYLEILSRK